MTRPPLAEAAEVVRLAMEQGVTQGSWPADRDPRDIDDLDALFHSMFTDEGARLRLSYGSRCARRVWYDHHEPEHAEPRDGMRVRHACGALFEAYAKVAMLPHLPEPYSMPREWEQRTLRAHGGITGHTDAALYYDGQPLALVDWKHTMSYVHKHWEHGRLPDPKWGYRHQAANYLEGARNEGIEFDGFIWLVGLMDKPNDLHVGWASRSELEPWGWEAAEHFQTARTSPTPPPPAHPGRDDSPCCVWHSKRDGRRTIYCPHLNFCENDSR